MSVVSLCIPRVFPNISEGRIRHIFAQLSLGIIERIDIVSTTNAKGEHFNRVFIHFREWFKNENADHALQRLLKGEEIKVIYDDPWFWKVSLYKKKEQPSPQQHQSHTQKSAVRLEFADIPIAPGLSLPNYQKQSPVVSRKDTNPRSTNQPSTNPRNTNQRSTNPRSTNQPSTNPRSTNQRNPNKYNKKNQQEASANKKKEEKVTLEEGEIIEEK
jgi:hypothetical protein